MLAKSPIEKRIPKRMMFMARVLQDMSFEICRKSSCVQG